ncbi:MAG: hypothetical protein AAFQ63_18125 [Cyanobacteria bacterium J06621_11]
MAGSISGVEKEQCGSGLVPIGGRLPHYLELRTSLILNCLQALMPNTTGSKNRKRLSASLASRARIGMYLEINEKLHLAYADQRDGRPLPEINAKTLTSRPNLYTADNLG